MGVTDNLIKLAQQAQSSTKTAPAKPSAPVKAAVKKAAPRVSKPVQVMQPPGPQADPFDGLFTPEEIAEGQRLGMTKFDMVKERMTKSQNTTENTAKVVDTSKRVNQALLDRPQVNALTGYANAVPGMQGQGEANDRLKAQMDEIQATMKPQVDLSPIAAFIDNTYGTNYSKTLPPAKTLLDKQTLLAGLSDKLAGNYGQQAQTHASLMNAFKLNTPGYVQGVITDQDLQRNIDTRQNTSAATQATPPPPRAGRGGGSGLKDLTKVTGQPAFKRLQAVQQVQNAVRNYQRIVAKYGYQFKGSGAAELDSARQAAITAAKELDKLGSLQAGEKELVENQIPDMTGFKGGLAYALGGGSSGAEAQFSNLLGRMEREAQVNSETLYNTFPNYPREQLSTLIDGAAAGARTGGTNAPDTNVVPLQGGSGSKPKSSSLDFLTRLRSKTNAK